MTVIRLTDIDRGDTDAVGDPGCDWHPRRDKPGAYDVEGNLPDLDDDEAEAHRQKPEAGLYPDVPGVSLSAESSMNSPRGEI